MSIESTQAIVLQHIKYGDTSLICQVYTENFGRRSFLFKGVRSKSSKIHPNILQTLFIINLQAYFKEGKDISLVKEASAGIIFTHFPYDNKKSAQAFFMAEILNKCLREEEPNRVLYAFIRNSVEYFDLMDFGSANFHILFLVKLSKHLGFYPSVRENPEEMIFDMKEGIYRENFPQHQEYIDPENSSILQEILNKNYDQLSGLEMNQRMRNELLDYVLKFYSIHIEGITRLKSLIILKELFN
jgi:DNA repair protein RecO (recombination protein O)